MKLDLICLTLLGTILLVQANPQRGGGGGRRGGGGGGGGRRPGRPGRGGGLKGPWEACEDVVTGPECGDRQKAKIYPGEGCRNLEVGDSFPEKGDFDNPCTDSVRI